MSGISNGVKVLIETLVFVVGLVVGSFLNVCIRRLPDNKRESIIFSRSRCLFCKKIIPWHDNIPLISFLVLGGKCRFCGKRISFQYFLVELLTGIIFLSFYLYFGKTPEFVIYTGFVCLLIVASFTDFNQRIIPEQIVLPGIVAGIVLSILYPAMHGKSSTYSSFVTSLVGMLTGGSFLYLAGVFGKWFFKKEAMGFGDVELLAMIGAFLGWKAVFLTIFFGSLFGSIVGIIMRVRKKAEYVPFGPYLSMGAIVSLFWGERIINLMTGG